MFGGSSCPRVCFKLCQQFQYWDIERTDALPIDLYTLQGLNLYTNVKVLQGEVACIWGNVGDRVNLHLVINGRMSSKQYPTTVHAVTRQHLFIKRPLEHNKFRR